MENCSFLYLLFVIFRFKTLSEVPGHLLDKEEEMQKGFLTFPNKFGATASSL